MSRHDLRASFAAPTYEKSGTGGPQVISMILSKIDTMIDI